MVIPKQIAKNFTKATHEIMEHSGKYKTYYTLKESCTYKNMLKLTAEVVNNCNSCQKSKPLNFSVNKLTRWHKPSTSFETVSIDLMGLYR